MVKFSRLLLLILPAAAQQFPAPEPPAPKSFAIMAWGDAPSEMAQLRGMREAGLNIAGFCRVADLDKVRDAGRAGFISDPRIDGYDWQTLPPDGEIRDRISQYTGKEEAFGGEMDWLAPGSGILLRIE